MKLKFTFSVILLLCACLYSSADVRLFVYKGIRYSADEETRECKVLYRTNQNLHTITIPNIVYDTIWEYVVPKGEIESVAVVDKLVGYTPSIIKGGAFQSNTDLISVNLGPITEIGNSAFFNTPIRSIGSKLVTNIGDGAFSNCSQLELVDFPNVKTIGSSAFYDCPQLDEVTFPQDTIIGQYAFSKCTKLVSAVFPKAVEIGYNAFADCQSLQSFVFPPSLSALGWSAFQGCTDLETITYTCPLLKEIPSSCFRYCKSLKDFDFFSMKLETIGSYAFDGCSSLTETIFSENLTAIEGFAFRGCSSLTKIYFNSEPTIGGSAFTDCTSLHTLHITANEQTPRLSNFLSNTINVLQVLELASNSSSIIPNDYAFGCSALHTVVLPSHIKIIGDRAFMNCKNLKNITLPMSLVRIGDAAFYQTALEEVTFPDKVTYIGNEAFRNSNLKEVLIPATVDTVGFHCFDTNEHLQRVSIEGTPEWLTNGGSSMAFNRCTEIMYIEMMCHRDTYNPNSLFYSSSGSVEEFRALEGSTAIGYNNPYYTGSQGAFNSFTNLKKVTIPEGVEVIGMAAFENCTSLTEIALPHSVDSIGYRAFAGSGLEEITLPTNIQWVDEEAFYKCKQLQKADMGGLEILPQYVLSNCQSLTCLIANNVRVLQRQACYNTSLVSVYLPAQCDSLLKDAILFNTTVKKVVCKAVTPPFASSMYNTFYVNSDIHLYVPSESIAAYKAAPLWQQFAFIEPLENNPADTDDCHEQDNTTPTALEEYKTPATISPLKMIDNGSMIIVMPDGTKYDVMGEKK